MFRPRGSGLIHPLLRKPCRANRNPAPTAGGRSEAARWCVVAATTRGETLTLVLNGRAIGSCAVPEFTNTQAQDCALGGNPHFTGNEFLAARFADFRFYARALSNEEIA